MKKIFFTKKPSKSKTGIPKKHPEQDACVELAGVLNGWSGLYPDITAENQFFFTHIGHGHKLHPAVARVLEMMGLRRGVSDYLCAKYDASLPVHWFEMKAGKNRLSEEQKHFAAVMQTNHCTFGTYFSVVDAFSELVRLGWITTAKLEDSDGIIEVVYSNGRKYVLRVQ